MTKLDRRRQNGPNRTNVNQIRLLNIYHFYCIFRAHISNVYFSIFFVFFKLKIKEFSPNIIKFPNFHPKMKKK